MNKKPYPLCRISYNHLFVSLLLATTLFSTSFTVHSQTTSKDDVRQYAERMCASWAEEDEVPANDLQQFIDDCIADFLLDEEEAQ